MNGSNTQFLHFRYLPMSQRLVYSMTLLVLGVGYLFAMIQVYTVHSGRDGKPGISAEDLRIAYHGNSGGTKLESALHGPMQGMLPPEERQVILAWAAAGASKQGYEQQVKPIMDSRCVACHNGADPSKPNLTSYDGVAKVVAKDTGASLPTLVRVSHIHLFGITFIFFIVSSIFVHAYIRPLWIKCAVIAFPFLTILMDITSWYLTKLIPGFAWMLIISGVLMGISFTIQWLTSIYQMWFYKPSAELEECGGVLPVLGGRPTCQAS